MRSPTNGSTLDTWLPFSPDPIYDQYLHQLPAVCERCCMAQTANILSVALYALTSASLFVAGHLAQPYIEIVLAPDPG
jgi:hypothetical protein